MATMGLNLTVGYAGQMSLGQAAFFGIGAYIAAIALKAGCAVPRSCCRSRRSPASSSAWRSAFPALRVQHHYLAFATLGFNVLVFLVMRNEEKITGGTFGISGIPRPSLFGFSLDGTSPSSTSRSASLVAARRSLLWWLLRSPWGRAFAALRDNPIRAESLGVNITAYTLLAFAIGAACAGIGGVYYASLVRVHRAGAVPLLDVAHDAARGHRRRLGPLLRSGDRHGRHRAAAGVAARLDAAVAQVHADLVPRGLRRSPSWC